MAKVLFNSDLRLWKDTNNQTLDFNSCSRLVQIVISVSISSRYVQRPLSHSDHLRYHSATASFLRCLQIAAIALLFWFCLSLRNFCRYIARSSIGSIPATKAGRVVRYGSEEANHPSTPRRYTEFISLVCKPYSIALVHTSKVYISMKVRTSSGSFRIDWVTHAVLGMVCDFSTRTRAPQLRAPFNRSTIWFLPSL